MSRHKNPAYWQDFFFTRDVALSAYWKEYPAVLQSLAPDYYRDLQNEGKENPAAGAGLFWFFTRGRQCY